MRPFFLALPILLEACDNPLQGSRDAATRPAADADDGISCQVAGASVFEPVCHVEQDQATEGKVLTLRKPDGGFRRLLVTSDGRGVMAWDGAEKAVVTLIEGDRIEVEIGGDRFRLPARIRT